MAETTSSREEATTFDAKRKPDDPPCCEPEEERSSKVLKLPVVVEGDSCNTVKNGQNGVHKLIDLVAEGKDGGLIEADVDEGDDDEEEDEDEESSEKPAEDRKGKGIMKDAKGKGKLIEEEDDGEDGDEDSSDDGSELGSDESELSDDPLAEVDLDNILPSRTRRRTVHPGVYSATDLGMDDDSSDSDA